MRLAGSWPRRRQGCSTSSSAHESTSCAATLLSPQAMGVGQALAVSNAQWAAAVLYNGLGRYEAALSAALQAAANTFEPWFSMWALPELVEAAARRGDL